MASEDREILAKISQVAGQINRHKIGKQYSAYPTNSQTGTGVGASYDYHANQTSIDRGGGRGHYSGRGRGYPRGGRMPQIRNRTLVLNGASAATLAESDGTKKAFYENLVPSSITPQSSPAWVTKTDRHLQLINPAIYEKQSQQRAKAIEATRKLKLKQRDERERMKLQNHLQHMNTPRGSSVASAYEILVQGVQFRVVQNGSKLLKVPGKRLTEHTDTAQNVNLSGSNLLVAGDENAAKSTPKMATIGGVNFYRSKNGNLYRSGIVKAHRRRGIIKKIDEPCKAFSTTGTCLKGPKCRYIHDPSKVAICKDFLQKGSCPAGEACDLSHDLKPERTPACLHFAKGNCSNTNCRYAHVRVSATALVCRQFGIYGYCEKGANCSDRHVHECPDFSNTGVCNSKGCKLLHRSKASVIRRNTAGGEHFTEAGSSDLSSDEDQDETNSDDVDSDDLDEEFFGQEDAEPSADTLLLQDFVQLQ